jgi:hypothetical protein
MDPVHPNDDGTVTARIYHTGPAYTLAMPIPLGADVERTKWEPWDYVFAGLAVARHLFIGALVCTVLWGVWAVVTAIGDWFGTYGAMLVGTAGTIAMVMLLLALFGRGGRRGCPGLISHCLGCRG